MAQPNRSPTNGTPPFLPRPISEDVLAALMLAGTTLEEAEAQRARLTALRAQNSAAIDTPRPGVQSESCQLSRGA